MKKRISLKKGMSPFVGCDVGELRLGLIKKVFDADKEIQSCFKQGLLSATTKNERIWLALTEKGKQHVIPMENRWSVI